MYYLASTESCLFHPQVLQKLKFLRHLTLKGNPICEVDGYRETVIDMLPNLESLDGKKVRYSGRVP